MGHGGSEAVALWTLQALQRRARITFATASTVDWAALNRAYGTRVDPSAIEVVRIGKLPFVERGDRIVTWQRSHFVSHCRRIARWFDLCISAYNPIDFGKPGIQLIGDFSFNERARLLLYPNAEDQFCHRQSLLRRLYLSAEELLWGWRTQPLAERGDCTVANSSWTATRLERLFRLPAPPVLHPPCAQPAAYPDTDRDPMSFVCLGRISAEKEIETIIGILDRIRAAGYPVTLEIPGEFGDDAYSVRIARLVSARRTWINTPGFLNSDAKIELFRRSSFAIHACRVEAFGIAVAEMAAFGLIPFVPHDGASREIVNLPELIYQSGTDAVGKIISILETPSRHATLRTELRRRANRYHPSEFVDGLIVLVEQFLGHRLPEFKISRPRPVDHVAALVPADL